MNTHWLLERNHPRIPPSVANPTPFITETTTKSNNAFLPAESIARICHAANAAYSAEICDNFNHLPWDELPQHLRDTTIAGVKARQDNPDMSPADMHENWLKSKREQGYSYGSVKDDDAKTHPCMLPYEELPAEQRTKDAIFSAIVNAISREV